MCSAVFNRQIKNLTKGNGKRKRIGELEIRKVNEILAAPRISIVIGDWWNANIKTTTDETIELFVCGEKATGYYSTI